MLDNYNQAIMLDYEETDNKETFLSDKTLLIIEEFVQMDNEMFISIEYYHEYKKETIVFKQKHFIFPFRDMKAVCDILVDYAEILLIFVEKRLLSSYHAALYYYYIKRFTKVAKAYSEYIEYDIALGIFNGSSFINNEVELKSCHGDLIKICDALYDYVEVINRYFRNNKFSDMLTDKKDGYLNNCNRIFINLSNLIDYDRDLQLAICMKKLAKKKTSNSNIGLDALTHMTKAY